MNQLRSVLTAMSLVALASLAGPGAHAQPGAAPLPPEAEEPPPADALPPAPPPPAPVAAMPPPPPPTPPPVSPEDARLAEFAPGIIEDANSGRNWLSPTALMPPKGTFTFSDFELFVIGASYSVDDRFQLSASTLLPIFADMPFLGLASGKLQLFKSGRLHGAAQGSVFHFRDDGDSATAFSLGGALTACLDDGCYSYASGYIGAGFAYEDSSSLPLVGSAALVVRLAKHVKLMFEVDSAAILGEIDAAADGVLLWYGVRFTSRHIGVDLGFAKPICEECGSDELPLGLPFIAVSYRAI